MTKLAIDAAEETFTREQYRVLLDIGLRRLTGETGLSGALHRLLPGKCIGMKTNCLARKLNSTPVVLTEAIGDLLEDASWEANDIVVWERTSRELEKAGYKLNASSFGRRCLGTDTSGLGYSREFYTFGEVNSLVSGVLTEVVDVNINLPVLKDHSIAGLSGGLKNMYGAINNPNKYHGDNCNPFVADVSCLAPLRAKNRLSIIDAVRVQYNNGPGFSRAFLENYHGLIMSDDPVAADAVGLAIVEHFREKNRLPSLPDAGRPATYLHTAQEHRLGLADLENIDLKVLAVDTNGEVKDGELW